VGLAQVVSLGPLLVLLAQDPGVAPTPGFLPAPTAVAPEPRYRLRPTPEGGYEYQDSRFQARIAPDGSVRFDDRRGEGRFYVVPLVPLEAGPATPSLESTLRDLLRGRKPVRPPTEPRVPQPLPPTGPMTEADRRRMEEYYYPVPFYRVLGTVDLTDEYYRMLGEDPYGYEKARFLASTFEMRLEMAAESQLHDLRRSLHELPGRLERLWSNTSHPPGARRLILCALFDELRGQENASEARNVIETFVRTHLPPGSPDAYTPAELQTCNASAGPAPANRFDPYTPPPPKPAPAPNAPASP
jgi:hypothetical protein